MDFTLFMFVIQSKKLLVARRAQHRTEAGNTDALLNIFEAQTPKHE